MRLMSAIVVIFFGLSFQALASDADGPATGAAVAPGTIAGKTIRGEIWNGFQNQQHLWRFKADGTVSGTLWYVQSAWRSSNFIQQNDLGTWRADGGRLCVTWRKFFGGGTQCYTLTELRPGWMRFADGTGGPSFSAQVSAR